MKLKFSLLCGVFVLCSFFNHILAQTTQITGKITKKASGEALSGASVSIKGGKIVDKQIGAVPKSVLDKKIQAHL